jgi:glycyl-tRNA synthetase (class II)
MLCWKVSRPEVPLYPAARTVPVFRFIYEGSEPYGSIGTAYDFGPLGCQLKKNLLDKWWRDFVVTRRDCYGVETAIIQNPRGIAALR